MQYQDIDISSISSYISSQYDKYCTCDQEDNDTFRVSFVCLQCIQQLCKYCVDVGHESHSLIHIGKLQQTINEICKQQVKLIAKTLQDTDNKVMEIQEFYDTIGQEHDNKHQQELRKLDGEWNKVDAICKQLSQLQPQINLKALLSFPQLQKLTAETCNRIDKTFAMSIHDMIKRHYLQTTETDNLKTLQPSEIHKISPKLFNWYIDYVVKCIMPDQVDSIIKDKTDQIVNNFNETAKLTINTITDISNKLQKDSVQLKQQLLFSLCMGQTGNTIQYTLISGYVYIFASSSFVCRISTKLSSQIPIKFDNKHNIKSNGEEYYMCDGRQLRYCQNQYRDLITNDLLQLVPDSKMLIKQQTMQSGEQQTVGCLLMVFTCVNVYSLMVYRIA